MAEAKVTQHETLAAALLAAQMEYPPLEKGSTVKVTMKSGGTYTYNYADLAYTKSVTDPYLWQHGLVIRDRGEVRDGQELLISTLTHIHSKESESSEFIVTDNTDMKGLGANVTYARRYNYWNLTGRIGEDDSENRPLPRQSKPSGGKQQPKSDTQGDQKPKGTKKPTTGPPSQDVIALKQQAAMLQNGILRDGLMPKIDLDALRMKICGGRNLPDDAGLLAQYIHELAQIESTRPKEDS